MVEGKVTVRLDRLEREGSKWKLVVGCDLEGKWVLHWGVTYCDDLGSEWDQPPAEMRPPGSIPIKDYAVGTPLKRSLSKFEGKNLHELQIDFDINNTIAAIHFVLKEEETGAWFQHKGRDFIVPLTDYLEENDSSNDAKQSFSILPGALAQISSLLLKSESSRSKPQDVIVDAKDTMQQNKLCAGFYEEYSISKEELVQNSMTVTVKTSNETDNKLVHFDTDIPGDVVVHWGVCRDKHKQWEIPSSPHPPSTKTFRQKALRTLLQPKADGLGSWGVFTVDKEFSGVLFVLKLSEYAWLNNLGTDFYIPLISVSDLSTQTSRDETANEQLQLTRTPEDHIALDFSKKESSEVKSKQVASAAFTDEIINEIRNLVTYISSERGKGRKNKETQEHILQEIEKLAAEAYSIFRSSSPTFVEESVPDAKLLTPTVQACSGTGSGYEILCQGFNWESHKSGKWYSKLNEKASELSSMGFTIIWLPPPTESVSPEGYIQHQHQHRL